jgi:hypothetical protein
MCPTIIKIALAGIFLLSGVASFSGISDYETTCSELGFKKRTAAYGECVLELDQRSKTVKAQPIEQPKLSQEQVSSSQGDGTPEHKTCSRFGFATSTPAYSDCRLKIDIAKREQAQKQLAYEADQRRYQEEQRQYEAKVAEYERQKEIQKSLALMRFGLSLMGGTSPNASENFANAGRASLGMAPVQPTRPQVQNFTITNPAGRMTNCNVIGNNINCF